MNEELRRKNVRLGLILASVALPSYNDYMRRSTLPEAFTFLSNDRVAMEQYYQDNRNFYLFSVSNDGYYTLELLQDGNWTTLIDPTQSDQIDTARNTLQVATRSDRIALSVNGTLLEETTDSTFSSGEVGLAVSTFPDSTGTISFDNLLITRNE